MNYRNEATNPPGST